MNTAAIFIWRFANAEFDEARWELRVGGQPVELESRPLEVLQHLLRHAGEAVTKEELLESIYGHQHIGEGALTNAVGKLRRALGDEQQTLIVTLHRIGYRFTGEVKRVALLQASGAPLSLKAGESVPRRERWKLLQPLGAGNSIEVWLARHEKTRERRVYKFSPDGLRLSALKREATLFRILKESLGERPCFARVLDWNFESTPFFIECEYGGPNLIEWAQAQGGLTAVPLSLRLELAAEIAEASAAAHSVGVLHKDLKPANVLVYADVDGACHARLTDFGSGRLLQAERLAVLGMTQMGFTHTQSVLNDPRDGTPLYLAPEVIAGQPPTALSDIYALGVILYQLTTGDMRQPMAPGWERRVNDELLRADISACADIEPSNRLTDANELARRLRGLAQRRTELERQRRETQVRESQQQSLIRRTRALRFALTLASFALVSAGFSAWQWQREVADRHAAETAAQTTRAINRFLNEDLLGGADAWTAGVGQDIRLEALLDKASARLDEDLSDGPDAYAQLSNTISRAYQNIGLFEKARTRIDHGLAALERRVGPSAPSTLGLLRELANFDLTVGRPADAEPIFRRVLQATEQRSGAQAVGDIFWLRESVAWSRYEQGYFAEAGELHRQLLRDAKAVAFDDPEFRADAEWNLVDIDNELGRWDESLQYLNDVEHYYLPRFGERHPRMLYLKLSRAYYLIEREQWQASEDLLLKVLEVSRAEIGERHPATTTALDFLGKSYLRRGQPERALPLLREALQMRMTFYGKQHYLTRTSMNRLGECELALGHVPEALTILGEAYGLSAQILGLSHPRTLDLERLLARAEALKGDSQAAEHHYREVVALGPERIQADDFRVADAHLGLARIFADSDRRADALDELARSEHEYRAVYGDADRTELRAIRAFRTTLLAAEATGRTASPAPMPSPSQSPHPQSHPS